MMDTWERGIETFELGCQALSPLYTDRQSLAPLRETHHIFLFLAFLPISLLITDAAPTIMIESRRFLCLDLRLYPIYFERER
uniref:Uncharacterized protein n=2 Tax=Picea TaxID=3328 RepID=A0A101M1T4_PICGL|nr:hypothetical protein ABT39_MTgene4032 [Picea glauca]QHR89726.1 hypothetical protein Q903MT_gene3748 [Picea sitchensis]